MTIYFDLETDGLYYDVTTIHCIGIKVDDEDIRSVTHQDLLKVVVVLLKNV